MARQTWMALRMDSLVMIFRALMSLRTSSTIFTPVSSPRAMRRPEVAGVVAPVGRVMPMASDMEHMVLAVPKYAQEPQDGQAVSSMAVYSSSVIRPEESMP